MERRESVKHRRSLSRRSLLHFQSSPVLNENPTFICYCCERKSLPFTPDPVQKSHSVCLSASNNDLGRKWLLPPLRKLSQSKVEKPTATEKPTASEKPLNKKASEKNLRLPPKHLEHDEDNAGNTSGSSTQFTTMHATSVNASSQMHNTSQQDFEVDEEAGLELPPPMKPIQEPHLIANGPPAFTKDSKDTSALLASTGKMDGNTAIDLSEIEQIVKEKTEQHEGKSKFLKPNFDINNSSNNSGGTGGGDLTNSDATNGRGLDGTSDLSYSNNTNNVNDNNDEINTDSSDKALEERRQHLSELISTEERYIQDLSHIVNGYIAEIRNPKNESTLPEDLKGGKERMVFGNIEAIYEWHRDHFYKALQRCQTSPAELGPLIKRYERKFQMYSVYCQNKPVSEHIITEHEQYFNSIRQKLQHRQDLSSYIIKPVQRITRYELLLKEILKYTERAGLTEEVPSLKEALQVMKNVVKGVNDTMVLRRLSNFNGKIYAQGQLLKHGPLLCSEDARGSDRHVSSLIQKSRELQVFLFEQCILFADIEKKKNQYSGPTFIYRSHIQVNKMELEELPNNRFLLRSTDPHRPDLQLVCCAATVDLNREWLETIRNILQSQINFLQAITSPIQYQKDLTKDT